MAAVVLAAMLPNAGNFGLAANRFAFGDPGLAHASVFFVTASVLTYTVGVAVASLGRAVVAVHRRPRVAILSSGDEPMVSYSVIDNGWDDEPWVVFSSNENDDDGMQMVCTR